MKLYDSGVYLVNGTELVADDAQAAAAIKSRTGREVAKAEAAQGTIPHPLRAHQLPQQSVRGGRHHQRG